MTDDDIYEYALEISYDVSYGDAAEGAKTLKKVLKKRDDEWFEALLAGHTRQDWEGEPITPQTVAKFIFDRFSQIDPYEGKGLRKLFEK